MMEYVEFNYFALTCQALDPNHSKTQLNTYKHRFSAEKMVYFFSQNILKRIKTLMHMFIRETAKKTTKTQIEGEKDKKYINKHMSSAGQPVRNCAKQCLKHLFVILNSNSRKTILSMTVQ